ncbi:hypothetical protein ACDQ54_06390 [Fusobacterium animalis]|uniref:hypothetical protein n=1 Tax=Fusobacterium animalis TaxID=76859 RepID=UPI00355787D6
MLDLVYYTKNSSISLSVSDMIYEKLANVGLDKVVKYLNYRIKIEDEEYEINAAKLNSKNRGKFLHLLDEEKQKELEKIFYLMDNSPTIKEFREISGYLKILTELYKMFKDKNNIYFSYE